MTTRKFGSQVAALICGVGIASGLAAAPQAGPDDAVAVCRAVLQDNVEEVSRLLADYRTPMAYSVATLSPGSARLRDARNVYLCNDKPLDEFAEFVGAERTSEMFAGETAGTEDYVAEAEVSASETQI